MIIKRDRYLQKLIERRHSSYIKIITGIRRCGKSYLLKKLYYDYLLSEGVNKEQIIMVIPSPIKARPPLPPSTPYPPGSPRPPKTCGAKRSRIL